MSTEQPTHHDAELVLKAYDLRRESVMRRSRDQINREFWPKSYDEFLAVTKLEHELNQAFRQTSTYWEMVYSFARHGAVHPEFFVESNGEGLFLFAKVEPYLERFRAEATPTAFTNSEWVARETEMGKRRVALLRTRVAQTLAQRK